MCGNNGRLYVFNGETGYLVRELVSHQCSHCVQMLVTKLYGVVASTTRQHVGMHW